MIRTTVKTTMGQADELFTAAQNELYKPEEDVVNYMVCSKAFKAINKYLAAFLMEHGEDIPASTSLEVLLGHCTKIDPKFKDLSLDKLYNTSVHEDVWMDIETAKEYMELAIKTKNMVKIIVPR